MRNENTPQFLRVRLKCGLTSLLALTVGSSYAASALASNNLELVLDGYAYSINSDVNINLGQQTIWVESDLDNCSRPFGQPPLNQANLILFTNNQQIGLNQFKYFVSSRLLFLTSESSNVICDNGIFVDQVFGQGFEAPVSPFLIFSDGFEN